MAAAVPTQPPYSPCDDWHLATAFHAHLWRSRFGRMCDGEPHSRCAHPQHAAANFQVCDSCVDHIVRAHPLVSRVRGHRKQLTPRRGWSTSISLQPTRLNALLTRLCRSCERFEMGKEFQRMERDRVYVTANTCTCHNLMQDMNGPHRRCYGHFRSKWHDVLRRRNRADEWLRNTEAVYYNGQ